MISSAVRNENIKKLRELMRGIPVGMLTAADESTGRLRTRPVPVSRRDFEGTLWFFTRRASATGDGAPPCDVTVSFSNEDKNLYISVSGRGAIVRDLEMMEELWHSSLATWFPKGLDDPELALWQIEVNHAEYWDGPDNAVQRLVGFVRAYASGDPYNGNENEELPMS